jgi:hypothetical protein
MEKLDTSEPALATNLDALIAETSTVKEEDVLDKAVTTGDVGSGSYNLFLTGTQP